MVTPVESALRRAVTDLNALKAQWALIGGLAISVRSVPRFTKDLDFAVAVAGDSEAEDVVHRLGGRGYRPVELLEQEYVKRMSGFRITLIAPIVATDVPIAKPNSQRFLFHFAAGPKYTGTVTYITKQNSRRRCQLLWLRAR